MLASFVATCMLMAPQSAPTSPVAKHGTIVLLMTLDPTKGQVDRGRIYIPQPPETPGQEMSYRIVSSHPVTSAPFNDNQIMMFPSDRGNVTIEYTFRTKPWDMTAKLKELEANEDAKWGGPAAWLKPTVSVDSRDPAFQAVVSKLDTKHPVTAVRSILAWMEQNFPSKSEFPLLPASKTLRRGYGECAANSMVFVGLCHAAKVPARVIQGLVSETGTYQPSGSIGIHMWAEVWFEGIGWVPVEPQEPDSLGNLASVKWLVHYIKLEHWDPGMSQYIPTNGFALSAASNLTLMTGIAKWPYRSTTGG